MLIKFDGPDWRNTLTFPPNLYTKIADVELLYLWSFFFFCFFFCVCVFTYLAIWVELLCLLLAFHIFFIPIFFLPNETTPNPHYFLFPFSFPSRIWLSKENRKPLFWSSPQMAVSVSTASTIPCLNSDTSTRLTFSSSPSLRFRLSSSSFLQFHQRIGTRGLSSPSPRTRILPLVNSLLFPSSFYFLLLTQIFLFCLQFRLNVFSFMCFLLR